MPLSQRERIHLRSGCEPQCLACAHRHLSQEESERQKSSWVRAELSHWEDSIQAIVSPKKRWGYRKKAFLHARIRDCAWAFGTLRYQGREEIFVPIPDCPLHAESVNKMFRWVSQLAPIHWPLFGALVSGDCLTLILKKKPDPKIMAEILCWRWPEEFSLFINWNPGAGKRAIDSRALVKIFGKDFFKDGQIVHGPTAFRQQISSMENHALDLAQAHLSGAGVRRVADLYCGLGASLKRWINLGWDSIGIELSGESLQSARMNAPGALLLRGRVEDRLPQIEKALAGKPFVFFTNPPRSGHSDAVLQWLLRLQPARGAYLSCHPRSLAADLRALSSGYRVVAIHPLDFFPQTSQVENLVLLESMEK